MLIQVRVGVGEVNLAGRTNVGKGVEDMSELGGGKLVGLVIAAVDAPEVAEKCQQIKFFWG